MDTPLLKDTDSINGGGKVVDVPAAAPPLPNQQQYAVYASRWWVLTLFSVSSALSAIMWICLAPVETLAQARWGVSSTAINAVSLVFLILYLPASILATVLMEVRGLRTTLVVGCALDAAGLLVKWGGTLVPASHPTTGYALVFAGQVLGALGQPLILNVPARLSMDWFPAHERELGTIAATMSNVVGQMVGSLVPGYVVTDADGLAWMMLAQAAPATLVFIAAAVSLPDAPPTPPSAAAAAQRAARTAAARSTNLRTLLAALWADVVALCRHTSFVLLATGFAIGTGMAWTLLTVQAQLILPCNYDNTVAGDSGGALLGVGVVTSFGVGVLLQRTKAYLGTQKAIMVASVAAAVFALAVNRPGNAGLVIGAWCVLGAVLEPLLPVTLEAAAELTSPIPADSSTTVLLVAANLVGTILIFVLGPLLALPASADCTTVFTPAAGVILGFMVVGALIVLPARGANLRQAAEANSSTGTQAEHSIASA